MDNSICALTDSLLKNLNGQSQSKVSCDPKSLHCTRCCQTICVNVFVPKSVRQSPTFRHQTTSSLPLSPETIGFSSQETLPRAIVMLRLDMSGQLKGFYTRKEVASHSRVQAIFDGVFGLSLQYTIYCHLRSCINLIAGEPQCPSLISAL